MNMLIIFARYNKTIYVFFLSPVIVFQSFFFGLGQDSIYHLTPLNTYSYLNGDLCPQELVESIDSMK